HVVEDLRPVVRGGSGPGSALHGRLDRVADVLAVTQRRFPCALARGADDRVAVVAVWPLLLAADVQLRGAIDPGRTIDTGAATGANSVALVAVVGGRTEHLRPCRRHQLAGLVARQGLLERRPEV